MITFVAVIAVLSAAIWLYLIAARGGFWLGAERDDRAAPAPTRWPSITAVVPARNEATVVGESVRSLLRQDYAGRLRVVLVDDDSDDATAGIAEAVGETSGRELVVVQSRGLPAGWTGKLWAVKQGIDAASVAEPPDYLLLTDADIVHAPDSVRWLAAQAEARKLVLASFMAKLRCESLPELSHVPAFIFFFQMLYPFGWVNRPGCATAAAAGGCMLVRTAALRQVGGIERIHNALIDDCSLAKQLKRVGPIWLGLTERVRSIRPYPHWEDVRRMVSRSAYAQLGYSPWLLAGTTLGMALTYLAPPLLALFGEGTIRLLGVVAWGLMTLAFVPTLRFYRLSALWALALPAIALLYMLYTLDSAYQYMRGRGGSWKGRVQASPTVR